MSHAGSLEQLRLAAEVISRFELIALQPTLQACAVLVRDDAPLDVAVLGQFKSGKSSLLNAVLGEAVFPVGAIPVTAVIIRMTAGPSLLVRVTRLDGSVEEVAPDRLGEYATEAGNPGNRRQVSAVDVFTPAMRNWPGIRLVDTPGLGSILIHNTEATRAWMPNVGVALIAVSVERPLAEEDRRLLAEARQTAPRVAVVLTKVDLLSEAELREVSAYLDGALREHFGIAVPVLPFSCRRETERWVRELQEAVLFPVLRDVAGERQAALVLKLSALLAACRSYLAVGLEAAQRADADRQQLQKAVLNESVSAAVIRDELRLAMQALHEKIRPAFVAFFLEQEQPLVHQLRTALATEMPTWQGNLAQQVLHYESWMAQRLQDELTTLSHEAISRADNLLAEAEGRFRRVIEAFRDRLIRNIRENTGLTISPLTWEATRPRVARIPVAVSRAFMTNWDLLWWMLPMWLVGGLFRGHLLGLVAWEATKNLTRLAGDWAGAVDGAANDLRTQASAWVDGELATLDRLLGQGSGEAVAVREALQRLDEGAAP